MQIMIDSADIAEIQEAASLGFVDGVTTNPSLLAKVGRTRDQVIPEICEIVNGPISAEVLATDLQGMLNEGRKLARLHKNVVIKLPLTIDGLKAVRALAPDGIRTNVTLCFTVTQALLAAKAGATYVSPFVGRLDDCSQRGLGLIADIVKVFGHYRFETKVLVASVRSPVHLLEAAQLGAGAATAPMGVLRQLVKHPLTDAGLIQFERDAKKWES